MENKSYLDKIDRDDLRQTEVVVGLKFEKGLIGLLIKKGVVKADELIDICDSMKLTAEMAKAGGLYKMQTPPEYIEILIGAWNEIVELKKEAINEVNGVIQDHKDDLILDSDTLS